MIDFSYFQKSKAFLYPILGINAKYVQPISTYLAIENFKFSDTLPFIALYDSTDPKFKETLSVLKDNTNYEYDLDLEDNTHIVIFDMHFIEKDYDTFKQGLYSQLSTNFKTIIRSQSITNKLILMALDPILNYPTIARELDVEIKSLEGKEIIPGPRLNTDGEVLYIKKLDELKSFYSN
jgi:hypothetical protein